MRSSEQNVLVNKVRNSFLDLGLAGFDCPAVLMVSGGSDSIALLLLTHELCRDIQGNASKLLVLHVNHQLRGAEADGDERFVVSLCEKLGIACVVERAPVAFLAQNSGAGLELAGRILRYELAEKAAASLLKRLSSQDERRQSCFILTAHTADDRAETLLQRLIVGGGGSSLASIPKRNGSIVRPLLDCTKEELRTWLVSRDLRIGHELWREDATNLDTTYSRAFVRHRLIPLLAERNPRIVESLNRTADVLTSESEWMDEQALRLLPLTSDSFDAPLPLLRRAVYLACNQAIRELAPEARITFEHIDLITRAGATNGFACQIPGGIEVRMLKGQLSFKKAKPPRHDPRK